MPKNVTGSEKLVGRLEPPFTNTRRPSPLALSVTGEVRLVVELLPEDLSVLPVGKIVRNELAGREGWLGYQQTVSPVS